jgi:mannose-1-phosphate guanylyltransferase/mannose-6-phosphate isomerase
MSCIYPVILSGGVGSRLWPLSRSHFPKQLLSLASEHSLIQETALRTAWPGFAKPLIICHAEHRFLVAEQMRAISIELDNIILEPLGRNTAPAAAIAALAIVEKDPEATLLLMPADHVISDQEALHEAIRVAKDQAKRGYLVTFGIHPRGPDTGYGYIQRGAALRDDGKAFAASRFVEKPDAETADRYLRNGDYYWNSGMFVFQAGAYLAELKRLEPDILAHCQRAIGEGKQDADYFHLGRDSFEACKSISIDYAVMEHTDRAAIVPVEMGWSDIGSWAALWDTSSKDTAGNVVKGDVLLHGTLNSYLRSEGPLIAAVGVEDLVIVASPDAVLVCPKSATQDIKKIVARLEREGRDLHLTHRKVLHSWGSSECIDRGENFAVNRITVNPGGALQLQARDLRAGRWIVISGTARVVRDHETLLLKENETCALSGADYRLENADDFPLHLIEVQAGNSSNQVSLPVSAAGMAAKLT